MRNNSPINTPKIMEAFYTKDALIVKSFAPSINPGKRAPNDTYTLKELERSRKNRI